MLSTVDGCPLYTGSVVWLPYFLCCLCSSHHSRCALSDVEQIVGGALIRRRKKFFMSELNGFIFESWWRKSAISFSNS